MIKIPERFFHCPRLAAGDCESPSLEAIHNLFRFQRASSGIGGRGGERRGGVLLRADPSRWRGSAMSQPSLLRFMKVMKQMLWELRIFHQAHTFPAKSAKAVLEIFKEKEAPFFSSPI